MHRTFKVKPTEELLLTLERVVQDQADMVEFKKIAVKVSTNFLRENKLTDDQAQTMLTHTERLIISTTMAELSSNFDKAQKEAERIIGHSTLN